MANKETEGGGGNKKLIIIIAVVAVLVIAIAAAAAVFILTSGNQDKEEELFFYSPGEAFTTNLQDRNSLVKATITIAYKDEKALEDLETNNAVIRNSIVFILRNKTTEQMQAADAETVLSNEICQKLNSELGVDYFVKIYFSDLVIQS